MRDGQTASLGGNVKFKVIGNGLLDKGNVLRVEFASVDPLTYYSDQIFLKVPIAEADKYRLGDTYILTKEQA